MRKVVDAVENINGESCMMSDLIFRLRALFRSKAVEADLDDELRFHIEREIQKQTMLGAAPSDAVRRSRIQFGGIEQIKEHCRDARGVRLFETLWQDIRYGARMLAKLPALTAIVVITLSLGIGANVAIFGILNSVLLCPLPVANPDQIVAVAIEQQNAPVGSSGFSYPAFRDFRDQTRKSVDLFGSAMSLADLSADEKAEQVAISFVTANYFSALGIAPAAGRLILPDEAEELDRKSTRLNSS